MKSLAGPHRRPAHRAATIEMKPSITTGMRQEAAPIKTPHMAARSRPPTLEMTSMGSTFFSVSRPASSRSAAPLPDAPLSQHSASRPCRARARSMTRFFFSKAASVRPAPLPVTSSTGRPVRAARTAEEVVVLPMPISPTPRTSTPSAAACLASSMPTPIAVTASCRVMAGSWARLPVPLRIRR